MMMTFSMAWFNDMGGGSARYSGLARQDHGFSAAVVHLDNLAFMDAGCMAVKHLHMQVDFSNLSCSI